MTGKPATGTPITRRSFTQLALATAATLPVWPTKAATPARVVIIGGGPGGATVARYLAKASAGLDITLIEPQLHYTTCFFSNLYLGGLRPFSSLVQGYDRLKEAYGIKVLHDLATSIDPAGKAVRTRAGVTLGYDRLVVAPGIDLRYDTIEGYDEAAAASMPHAWKAGAQTRLLKRQIDAMETGGTVIICPPPLPYRCPPAPYERASMIAWALKLRGNKTAKILIVDAKDSFTKQALFEEGWQRHYPGMIEWLPQDMTGGVSSVNTAAMEVITGGGERLRGSVVNVIPAQKAGLVAARAGLTDKSGWCPVHPTTMQSRLDEDIHIIGDAARAGDMPKSGFSANSQAKLAAMIILADLTGHRRFEPVLRNNCWSMIAAGDAVKLGARYKVKGGHIELSASYASQTGESRATRHHTATEALGWYAAMVSDIFG
jgi:NADPH-dependent 2,4-dienoyl-CoA reductase/sulfur reductase-like enzyme